MSANTSLQSIEKLESDLWEAADNLRANSKLTSSEYCMPVLGIIFLRHAANRFEMATRQIAEDQKSGKMPKRKIVAADYVKRRALFLPEEARYDHILATPTDADLSEALIHAMTAIEQSFEPLLGVLPKDFGIFERNVLEDLMRTFNREALRNATGDVFGRIYEYFLMKFAMQGAQDNGEFFTPPSLVNMLVNVIEPDHGVVADLACGSGGMFVQSSHFIEAHGGETMRKVTFYGQEKTATTIKLAKMNLAVHGLEGHIAEANTFYQDEHRLPDGRRLFGNVDFGMANPPFNVDMVDAEKVKDDPRLPFGLPGVNKDKKVSNGNYLWISYFHSYLSAQGRAGFVMSSQASSAGHGEMEVRRKLVETGDVDVMISIRSNFFYTRTVPCELWHFDKGKPAARRDQVLMLDARNVYRKVTRKIYDFSPEQLANLTAIVWLYRGESGKFSGLVQQYLERTLAEAAAIAGQANGFRKNYEALAKATAPFLKSLPKDSPLLVLLKERDDAAKSCFASLDAWSARIAKDWKKPCAATPAAQRKLSAGLDALAVACRDLIKDLDLVFKLATRLVDTAEKDADAKDDATWITREIGKLEKNLDARRAEAVDQLKATAYFERQAHWLLSRFPDAKLIDIPGLVKLVDRQAIAAADWSLTPGRYVGVAPAEIDDDFDFEQTLGDIHIEIADLNQEAAELAKRIQKNFEGLGV
ncbi:MAG: N-6 DNA methylase [Verrucomicrobiota bacterium]